MTGQADVALYENQLPDLATLDWDGLVDLGRKIAYAGQWLLGDVACRVETSYGDHTLGRYAEQIGISHSTLRDYTQVAKAYPPGSVARTTHPWSVYKVLAAQDDRLELVDRDRMTVTEAQQIVWDRDHRAVAQRMQNEARRFGQKITTMKAQLPPSSDAMVARFTPQDEETQERIRQAELTARERELAEQDDKDRILGSTEILNDLARCRDRVDSFVTRWWRRRIKLAAAEKKVFDSEVAALQRVVDQIRRLGEGRESLEDELQRIADGEAK